MTKKLFEPAHSHLGRHIASGLLSMGFLQAVRILCQFGSVVVLSRLLTPSEFGVVAMAAPVIGFAGLLQDLGLSQATIQKRGLGEEEVNAFFWINLGVGACLSALVVALSPLAGSYYHEARAVQVTAAFGGLIFLGSLGSQPGAIMTRRMLYRASAINGVISAVAGLAASVCAALFIKNWWALYLGAVVSMLSGVIGAFIVSGFRPGLPRRAAGLMPMLKFGVGVMSANMAGFLSRNTDNLLIGWRWGEASLGLYDRAYKLLLFPIERLAGPMMQTMLPVLCHLSGEPVRYRRVYLKALSCLLLLSWPGICWAIVFGDGVVRLLLGAGWTGVSAIFIPLAVTALVQMLNNGSGYLYISQGRSGELARWAMIGAAVDIASFAAGLPFGPAGVAKAYAVSEYLRTPFLWYLVTRSGPVRLRDIVGAIAPQARGAGLALAALSGIKIVSGTDGTLTLGLALGASYVGFAVGLVISEAGRETLFEGVRRLRGFLSKQSEATAAAEPNSTPPPGV